MILNIPAVSHPEEEISEWMPKQEKREETPRGAGAETAGGTPEHECEDCESREQDDSGNVKRYKIRQPRESCGYSSARHQPNQQRSRTVAQERGGGEKALGELISLLNVGQKGRERERRPEREDGVGRDGKSRVEAGHKFVEEDIVVAIDKIYRL